MGGFTSSCTDPRDEVRFNRSSHNHRLTRRHRALCRAREAIVIIIIILPQTFQIQDLAAAATEIVRLPVNFSFFLCRDLFAPALSSWP